MRSLHRAGAYLILVSAAAAAAAAQTPGAQPARRPPRPFVEHGFIAIGAGIQSQAGDLSDRVQFEANTETATIDASYPGRPGVLFDGTVGFRVRQPFGLAVAVARASRSGEAAVTAMIPHPFFDDRPRTVEGDAQDITRTETAVHVQLYYELRPHGHWRMRLFGGPSYVNVEQQLVTEVEARETFPFDTAEFGRARTVRATGSGIGFNAGVDLSRMLSRRAGLGGTIRYAAASIDLDASGAHSISIDGGGLQATAGLRFLF